MGIEPLKALVKTGNNYPPFQWRVSMLPTSSRYAKWLMGNVTSKTDVRRFALTTQPQSTVRDIWTGRYNRSQITTVICLGICLGGGRGVEPISHNRNTKPV